VSNRRRRGAQGDRKNVRDGCRGAQGRAHAFPPGKAQHAVRAERCREDDAPQDHRWADLAQRGRVWVKGKRVDGPGRSAPSFSTDFALCRGERPAERVRFGLELRGTPGRISASRSPASFIGERSAWPASSRAIAHQLSRRDAAARRAGRALTVDADIILMDEPFPPWTSRPAASSRRTCWTCSGIDRRR